MWYNKKIVKEILSAYTEGEPVEKQARVDGAGLHATKPEEAAFTDGLLSAAYQQQLLDAGLGNSQDIHTIAHEWRYAPLEQQPGEKLPYVRLGQYPIVPGAQTRPIMYIPGFTEGIVAKAPFALAMADRGADIIVPDQNRKKILKDAASKKSAVYSQAVNYMAVIEAEQLTHTPIDVVPHSFGAKIFDRMITEAKERKWTCFDGTNAIFLAPGNSDSSKGILRLGARFAANMISETVKKPRDVPDEHGEMLKAGSKNLLTNLPRAWREIMELAYRRIDYDKLMKSGIGSVAVLGYADDRLFPHRVLAKPMAEALSHGAAYATPYSLREADGRLRGGDDATHNDEQFNPERVANAVSQLLRLSHQRAD